MKITNIPLGNSSKRLIARKRYEKWRTRSKESKIYIATLFAMCNGSCPECGCEMFLSFSVKNNRSPYKATLDHITPLAEVEKHDKFGLRIMCYRCNQKLGIKFNNGLDKAGGK